MQANIVVEASVDFIGYGEAMPRLTNCDAVYKRTAATTTEPYERHRRLFEAERQEVLAEFHEWRRVKNLYENPPKGLPQLESSSLRLDVFLSYLSRGGYFVEVGLTNGVAESTAWTYSHEVAEFFADIAEYYIKLPTVAELPSLVDDVDGRQVVVYLDGMLQRIQKPALTDDAFYSGRPGKCFEALNIQVIADKNGIIRHIVGGCPGPMHDLTAVRSSPWFVNWVNNLPAPYHACADSAYVGMGPNVIVPFVHRGQAVLTPQQTAFNDLLSKKRSLIEQVNGAIQVKFRLNQSKENRVAALVNPDFASQCMLASAVLHNRFTNYLWG